MQYFLSQKKPRSVNAIKRAVTLINCKMAVIRQLDQTRQKGERGLAKIIVAWVAIFTEKKSERQLTRVTPTHDTTSYETALSGFHISN